MAECVGCFSFYSDKRKAIDAMLSRRGGWPQLRRSCVGHDVVRQDTTRATVYIATARRRGRRTMKTMMIH